MKSLIISAVVFLCFSLIKQESREVKNQVTFSVPKFFWTVKGTFSEIAGEVNFDPEKPEQSSILGTVLISSIETGNALRDEHLQGKDWFDSKRYPLVRIQSKAFKKLKELNYVGTFEVSMKGESQEKEIKFTIDDPKKPESIRAEFSINLSDFDIGSGSGVDWVVGNEVIVKVILLNSITKS